MPKAILEDGRADLSQLAMICDEKMIADRLAVEGIAADQKGNDNEHQEVCRSQDNKGPEDSPDHR